MRSVQIHQVIAESFQISERRWGAIDELPVHSRGGQTALQNQIIVARLDPGILKAGFEFFQAITIEYGLDCAGVRAGANERYVGAFDRHEWEGRDTDLLPGS